MDEKAIGILLNTYWSSAGWKLTPDISEDDFRYALQAGVMFEPWLVGHDDLVASIILLRKAIDLIEVSNAFLASLTHRRLDLRSALGSYAVAINFPDHHFTGERACNICGHYGEDIKEEDVNVLNFERFKFGGVRHTSPLYIVLDLEQFLLAEKSSPTSEDIEVMNRIISCIEGLPPEARPSHIEKSLAKIFKSNKNERTGLIQILGYCGILEPQGHPGFATRFTNARDIPWPPGLRNDWVYPVNRWRGSDGINREALKRFFPQIVMQ